MDDQRRNDPRYLRKPYKGAEIPENNGKKPAPTKAEMRKKAAKKKMFLKNTRNIFIILVLVIGISFGLASVAISCINDILAIHIPEKKDQSVSVVIPDGMNTEQVIDILGDAGLIKNPWFCKIAAQLIGYNDDGYIARTYDFKRSMGLENMINEIKNNTSKTAKTITLTFPEGYTVEQILAMLEENNVCSRNKLVENMMNTDYSENYAFLKSISNPNERYMYLEGYLFPDTYEFYIGESAESVIKKFIDNFSKKWDDNYNSLANEKLLTSDQVIKLASIVEKEAVDDDMPIVASILLNRLEAGMPLECDSTSGYIDGSSVGLSEDQKVAFNQIYDTYVCRSYPAGPICNPGRNAIEAVLNAPSTGYYYFIHDSNNEFHAAKTLQEQEQNIASYGLAN